MNNYKPTPSQRKDKRYKKQLETVFVEAIDEEYMDIFKDKIQFWSLTFFGVKPSTLDTYFKVYTPKVTLPKSIVIKRIKEYLPNSVIKFDLGYNQVNTFTIRTSNPIAWGRLKWLVVNALGDYL